MAISRLPKVIIAVLLCFATQISDRVCVQVIGFEMPTRVSAERKNAELLRLSINTVRDSFSSKEPIYVQFHFKNVSKTVLTVKQVAPVRDYKLDVTTESGKRIPVTELGNTLESRQKKDEHAVKYIKLEPDKELLDALDIREIFKIASAGTYIIRARRTFYPGRGAQSVEVVSNTIKVKIIG